MAGSTVDWSTKQYCIEVHMKRYWLRKALLLPFHYCWALFRIYPWKSYLKLYTYMWYKNVQKLTSSWVESTTSIRDETWRINETFTLICFVDKRRDKNVPKTGGRKDLKWQWKNSKGSYIEPGRSGNAFNG